MWDFRSSSIAAQGVHLDLKSDCSRAVGCEFMIGAKWGYVFA